MPRRLRADIVKKIKRQNHSTEAAAGIAEQTEELKKLKKKWRLALIISAAGIFIIIGALIWSPSKNKSLANPSSIAVTDHCVNTDTYSCYKKELTDITKAQGPEQATGLIKQAYSTSSYVKSQCHQLMHIVGRTALEKYGDISNTYAHGDQFCWSGYYHGAMEQIAIDKGFDYIVKNANSICAPIAAKGKYSFYHYNCVHGLGHGFMFVKDGDLFASLSACDSLTDSWERTSCYGGKL
jgi:hypothetical protein